MAAAERIERFLEEHPDGHLLVAVGYASAAGLAWLNRRTEGRNVRLVVGDTRKAYWANASNADREAALAFLGRSDVEVRNWYRTRRSSQGAAMAHLKVWVVYGADSVEAVLVGSANLTNDGLLNNIEAVVEATGPDLHDTYKQVLDLWNMSWQCEERLIGYLTETDAPPPSRSDARAHRPRAKRPQHAPAARTGCASVVVLFAAAVLAGSLALWLLAVG